MYLKKLVLENFRKFQTTDNAIEFVYAGDYTKDNEINIAPKSTLVIGKNNSGKTTVVTALDKLVHKSGFRAADFNFVYLKRLLQHYKDKNWNDNNQTLELPAIRFIIVIGLDGGKEDLITNLVPFMTLEDVEQSEIEIHIEWSIHEEELFSESIKTFIHKDYKSQEFDHFIALINGTEFSTKYYDKNGEKRDHFSLGNLIEMVSIKANNISNDSCLTDAFSRIIDYRYSKVIDPDVADALDSEIIRINEKMTKDMQTNHTDSINKSLRTMIHGSKCQVLLKSDLTFQKLVNSVLKYEYLEGSHSIPEQQFGLGYTNLMMIVAEIITYLEKYPKTAFNSQINLISIEEPETYMHPQMQEMFIANINDMIASLLDTNDKHVNSQIIITTHSPHILNSKIHEGNTFDSIAYITTENDCARAICLHDSMIVKKSENPTHEAETLVFIKKHIKFKVSEVFFADAVIFVEGITEFTLLQYYIKADPSLNKYFITIILIDGAHAKVYEHLIETLGIPALTITDIDFKRSTSERGESNAEDLTQNSVFMQMSGKKLKERTSTNPTLSHYYGTKNVEEIIEKGYKAIGHTYLVFQKKAIHRYYPTSFEEAFILTNHDNLILHNTLKSIKPRIYQQILKDGGLAKNSYRLQCKLSDSKSQFANELLYKILVANDNIPLLPNYIVDGINYIKTDLGEKK